MKFTNSPYETMMQQVPRYERPEPVKAPEGSRCHGCPYWRGDVYKRQQQMQIKKRVSPIRTYPWSECH